MNFLICLAGLPASGKSTFAGILKRNLSEAIKNHNVIIVDPDLIRKSLTNNEFDPAKEKIVRKKNLSKISEALREGKIVISDDLNYYTSMRHDLKNMTDNLGLNFFMIHIATPLKTCLKWNEKRGRTIPDDIIESINEKFDFFDKYQWDRPFYEFDPSSTLDLDMNARDIVSKIESALVLPCITIQEKIHQKMNSNSHKERLEKITRQTVGKLLKNSKNISLKKEILDLRKKFTKLYLDNTLTESEIREKLILYLEEALDKKLR